MRWVSLILLGVIIAAGGYYVGKSQAKNDNVPTVRVDTVYRDKVKHDTCYLTKTKRVWLDRVVRDTITVTTLKVDTVEVEVPIYKYVFKEDSLYRAEVSGYSVTLDKLEVYQKTVFKTRESRDRRRWGVGVQAGYGLSLENPARFVPYVGIGVSYNIIRF